MSLRTQLNGRLGGPVLHLSGPGKNVTEGESREKDFSRIGGECVEVTKYPFKKDYLRFSAP